MGVALGLEPPKGLWDTDRYHTEYYDDIPGVSVDKSGMVNLYQDGVSKELFYELDADVHVMDPNFLSNQFKGWEASDIAEIEENVSPLFGNCIYVQHFQWHDDYRYYSLYDGFEKLAKVFQRTDRYEAFTEVHAGFKENLASVIPDQGERPEVAVLWALGDEPKTYWPYLIGEGTGFKHLRELNVRDALAETDIKDFNESRGSIGLETLLDIDPEVLLLREISDLTSRTEFEDRIVTFLENHDVGSQLTAVKNGDVYRAGGLYQGPITYMALTERTARQLYDFDKELFDRDRVGAIVNGEI
jgi:iron complex transport system substrate-binding protein